MLLLDIGNQTVRDGFVSNNYNEIHNRRSNCNPEYYIVYLMEKKFGSIEVFSKLQVFKSTTTQSINNFRKKSIQEIKGWYSHVC